ncbi:hypothetical protein LAUMK142_00462 [Mycobacterium pseudokansasii]|uniref:Uncharacterized protein n=2 Tax=Mycobacterium pseudokansasii TaxID=2341080 RepID=A0A498QL88_9MYCO|nr:hypothetical protein LAUMK142_00462 [Mycobacterium pseudokansasii]
MSLAAGPVSVPYPDAPRAAVAIAMKGLAYSPCRDATSPTPRGMGFSEMADDGLPLRDRGLNAVEMTALRLILSTYRDGSGQVVLKATGETMPGFRDFERALAAVTNGATTENKGIFDVIVPASPLPYGLSAKMSKIQPERNKCSFMELANSAAKFRQNLLDKQINWNRCWPAPKSWIR